MKTRDLHCGVGKEGFPRGYVNGQSNLFYQYFTSFDCCGYEQKQRPIQMQRYRGEEEKNKHRQRLQRILMPLFRLPCASRGHCDSIQPSNYSAHYVREE